MDLAQIILSPFVWLLTFFYGLFDSYGIALILFAIVIKLILFPFSIKSKRSMIQMNMLSGQMEKLKKQYGRDQARYNEEVQKLYAKENINPMSGCLWSLVPMLILFPLYAIIRQPLKYMMGLNTQELFNAVADTVNWSSAALDAGWLKAAAETFANTGYNQLYLSSLITPANLSAVQSALNSVLAGAGDKVFSINFDFLGLVDLSQIPQLKFWTVSGGFGLFLLPVISAITGFLFSLLSMKTNAVNRQSAQASNPSSKSMMIISPLISLWIGFAMPAALCLYWIANNLLSMLQEVVGGRLLKKDYEKAAALKAERERQEKEEEKEQKRLAAEERARRIEEEKQNRGKKKKPVKKPAEDENKIPAAVKEASRVGLRQYARGRAYDPYRYSSGGPTPYPGEEPLFPSKEEGQKPDALPESIEEERTGKKISLEKPGGPPPDDAAEAESPYAEESEEAGE